MYTADDVTLYIPYYNTPDTIGPALDGVFRQTARPRRVIVIDDGSQVPFVNNSVDIIAHAANSGLATGRNTALDNCQTALIASLDSDVVPDPQWLKELLNVINSDHIVGTGGKLIEQYQDNLGNRWRAEHMKQHWGDKPVRNPRFLYGANTLYEADSLRAVGRYDERLRTNNEDRTISDALYAACKDLMYTPKATCRHLRHDTYQTILHGYWQWHHARGLLRGDFNSIEGIIKRISEVNFGIFRYRYNLDVKNGRHDLLGLDACVPWVFCTLDLQLFHKCTGIDVPDFPGLLLQTVPNSIKLLLEDMFIPLPKAKGAVDPRLANDYITTFVDCLKRFHWYEDSGHTEAMHGRVDPAIKAIPV